MSLLGLLITETVQAQTAEKAAPKHEIGLNTGPVLVALLGGAQQTQAMGIYYKRITSSGALRLQLTNATPLNGGTTDFQAYQEVFSPVDSILITRQGTERNRGNVLWLGKEYRVQKRNGWAFTYGFDLGFRYGLNSFRVQDLRYSGTYVIDSLANQKNYRLGNWEGATDVSLRQTDSYGAGARVTVGALKELSPRFFLHMQSGFSAFVQQNRGSVTDYQNGTKANFTNQSFDFNSGPFIHELGLYYRF